MSTDTVSILDGNTFVVSDGRGDIEAQPDDPTGLFAWDTRFLSRWILTVGGQRLNVLSTDDLQYFQVQFFLVASTDTVYVDSAVSIIRQRAVGNGFHEDVTVMNHGAEAVDLTIRIEADADFADLFEVKDALAKKGEYYRRVADDALVLGYRRSTFTRETRVFAADAVTDDGGLTFSVHIEPHAQWATCIDVVTARLGARSPITRAKYCHGDSHARPIMERSLDSSGATWPSRSVWRGKRRRSSGASTATSGSRTGSSTRWRSTATGAGSTHLRRTSGTCCGVGSPTRRRPKRASGI